MSEAGGAAARVASLFGPRADLEARTIHVAAVWEETPGERRFIAVGEGSPESETDRFLLDLSRARADVVLTTGAILRAEPDVTHAIQTPGLASWRRDVAGKRSGLVRAVLTSGRNLDPAHPLFAASPRAMLLVPEHARVPPALEGLAHRLSDLTPRRAVEHLLERFETIDLEVGPRVSTDLYEAGGLLDELVLSTYLEPGLAPVFRGGAFPSSEPVHRALPVRAAVHHSIEASGRWRFERFRRSD